MKAMKRIAVAVAISAGMFGASGVMAATQGQLGVTSTGNFEINFQKGSVARIWGFQDLSLSDAAVDEANAVTADICVFSNKAPDSNAYQLEIESANKFQLLGGGLDGSGAVTALDYDIKVEGFREGRGALDNANVTHGTTASVTSPNGSFLNAGALLKQPNPALDCTSKQNAKIKVWAVGGASLTSGAYTDVVTLTVTPQ